MGHAVDDSLTQAKIRPTILTSTLHLIYPFAIFKKYILITPYLQFLC